MGLVASPPRERFSHRVEEFDPSLGVGGDHRIADALERCAKPLGLLPQLVPKVALRGDIAHQQGQTLRAPRSLAQRRQREQPHEGAAVLTLLEHFAIIVPLGQRRFPDFSRLAGRPRRWRVEICKLPADRLLRGIAIKPGRAAGKAHNPPGQVQQHDGVVDHRLREMAQQLCRQRPAGCSASPVAFPGLGHLRRPPPVRPGSRQARPRKQPGAKRRLSAPAKPPGSKITAPLV
jgi:hypothetical protein